VDDELEVIRHQMEAKQASLATKLDALENQVLEIAHETTAEVSSIVQDVRATVDTVTEDVKATVDTVTEGAQEVVESVKETFNVSDRVRSHPWLAMGAAFAAGLAGGWMLGPARSTHRTGWWSGEPDWDAMTDYSAARPSTPVPERGASRHQDTESHEESTSPLGEVASEVLTKVKSLAVGTLMGVIGKMVVQSLPPALESEASNLLRDVTTKLGGQVIDFSQGMGETTERETGASHDRNQGQMPGAMATAPMSGQGANGKER
jgi:ElaB/YqjD/DUF883 family membrane-anchored ribosome-binding protein